MKTVITPIGTSLIANYIDDFLAEKENREVNEDVKAVYNDIRDKQEVEQSDLDDIKDDLIEYLKDYDSACAEKTSIDKIKADFTDIKIILIVSETQISRFLGEIFKDYFGESCKIKEIIGLQIDDKERFENEGLHNFIEFFKTLKKENLILNITAGYKAFIPYLTIIGQVYTIPIKYIFEESDSLISIPELPIGFDDKVADLYLQYLNNYLLENLNLSQGINSKLIQYGFIKNNKLTVLGELFRDYMNHKPSYLGDLMEYLLLGIYIQDKSLTIEKSKPYSINGQKGDIDLIITRDNTIEFIEVKSFGQFKKFKDKQLKKYTNYILQEFQNESKTITVLFYLLDSSLLNEFQEDFKVIESDLKDKDIQFKVKYIEVKPENFQKFVKEFENKQIKEFNYEQY
jgi:putative CRISPR-associated protein (TIGR02619 family)